jgi:hypothetical protein
VSAFATLGRHATTKYVGDRVPWLAVPPHVCRGAHITLPPQYILEDMDFLHRFFLLSFSPDLLIDTPSRRWGDEKQKKNRGWETHL